MGDNSNFGPARKGVLRRTTLWSATALLVCALALYAGGYSIERYRVQRARNLVAELQALRVGLTTEEQIRNLSQNYDAKYFAPTKPAQNNLRQATHYDLEVSGPRVVIRDSPHALPGRRLWSVLAYLDVENGLLSRMRLTQFVVRSDGLILDASVVLTGQQSDMFDEGPYHVYEAHVTGASAEAFGIRLMPTATEQERSKAFDFKLLCLNGIRECRHVSEILPNAWKDLPPGERLRYEDGRDVVSDSECRERMQASPP